MVPTRNSPVRIPLLGGRVLDAAQAIRRSQLSPGVCSHPRECMRGLLATIPCTNAATGKKAHGTGEQTSDVSRSWSTVAQITENSAWLTARLNNRAERFKRHMERTHLQPHISRC